MLTFLVIAVLLGSTYFLPPDTSLARLKEDGILRVCVPNAYPPLVTGDAQAPGIDVELLQMIASRLGVRLVLNPNSAMGRDFNPRNWRVTRAQCQVLAGGVVSSRLTRSFLETTEPYLHTGWVELLPSGQENLSSSSVGVFSGVSGLDRIGLSRYLREQGSTVSIANTAAAFEEGLAQTQFDIGVTEAMLGSQIAARHGWDVNWLSDSLEQYSVVFGLWKGDLTLKRAFSKEFNRLQQEGVVDSIIEKYLGPPLPSGFDIRIQG